MAVAEEKVKLAAEWAAVDQARMQLAEDRYAFAEKRAAAAAVAAAVVTVDCGVQCPGDGEAGTVQAETLQAEVDTLIRKGAGRTTNRKNNAVLALEQAQVSRGGHPTRRLLVPAPPPVPQQGGASRRRRNDAIAAVTARRQHHKAGLLPEPFLPKIDSPRGAELVGSLPTLADAQLPVVSRPTLFNAQLPAADAFPAIGQPVPRQQTLLDAQASLWGKTPVS